MKFLILVLFATLVTGCVSSITDNAAEKDGVVCKSDRPTGSNIPTRICRTADQIEAIEK